MKAKLIRRIAWRIGVLSVILVGLQLSAQDGNDDRNNGSVPVHITLLAGDGQMDAPNVLLGTPLEVLVTDAAGAAVAGYPVNFQVGSGGGLLADGGDEEGIGTAKEMTVCTGATGRAAVFLQLGDSAPGTLNLVQAGVAGGVVSFHCYTAGLLSVVSGDAQVGKSGAWTSLPLRVRMDDALGHPMPAGLPVYFRVYAGGGELGRTPAGKGVGFWPVYAALDATGGAQLYLKLAGSAFADNAVWISAGTPEGDGISMHGYVSGNLSISGGDAQVGSANLWLPQPLQVSLVDQAGRPVSGQCVVFRPVADSGTLADSLPGGGSDDSLFVVTDSAGVAGAYFRPAAGAGTQAAVTATVNSGAPFWAEERVFNISFSCPCPPVVDIDNNGLPDWWEQLHFGGLGQPGGGPAEDPDHDGVTNLAEYRRGTDPNDYYNGSKPVVTVVGGDHQSASAGAFDAEPITVWVRDAGGNSLPGAPLSFTVTQGAGQLALQAGETELRSAKLSISTDASGQARVYFRQPDEFGPAGLVTIAAGNTVVTVTTTTLDYRNCADLLKADFETGEGYAAGPLDGQDGWLVGFGTAEVTPQNQISGEFAVQLDPTLSDPPFIQHDIVTDPAPPVCFVDFYARLAADADPAATSSFGTDSAWVNLQIKDGHGEVFARDGDWGIGSWRDTGVSFPLDGGLAMTTWARFTLRMDYASRTWDLYVDGRMVLAELKFNDPYTDRLFGFWFCGNAQQATWLDFFHAGHENPLFVDADCDGMEDAWELAHGLDPGIDDRVRDLDGDQLDNVQEYVAGTAPDNADTDGDGLTDGWEVAHGFNPLDAADGRAESAHDGLPDWWKIANFGTTAVDPDLDADGDGVSNLEEYLRGTDPRDFYNGLTPIVAELTNGSGYTVRVTGYSRPIPAVSTAVSTAVARHAGGAAVAAAIGQAAASKNGGVEAGAVVIRLLGANGAALANAPVTFSVLGGSGGLSQDPAGNLSSRLLLRTDANGTVKLYAATPTQSGGVLTITFDTGDAAGDQGLGGDAPAAKSPYVFIDLGGEPLGIADNGMITLLRAIPGDLPMLARWRSGVCSNLETPPLSLFNYPNDTRSNLDFAVRPDSQWEDLKLNRNGLMASRASDGVFNETITGIDSEEFVIVWPAAADTPVAIKGPFIVSSNIDDSRQIDRDSFAYLLVLDNGDGLWIKRYDEQSGYQTYLYVNGSDTLMAFAPTDANAAHETVNGGFWGEPVNEAGQVRLCINDVGAILADDDPTGAGFGAVPLKTDVYAASIIQTCRGYAARAPYVLAGGNKHYLLGVDSASPVRLSGFDEAGNVYGSLNPTYQSNLLVDPGVDVIWVADPAAWGLPADIPAYTPILWMQPTLPGNEISRYGIQPGAARVQLGVTTGGRGFALVPAQLVADVADLGRIKPVPGGDSDDSAPATSFPFWLAPNLGSAEDE